MSGGLRWSGISLGFSFRSYSSTSAVFNSSATLVNNEKSQLVCLLLLLVGILTMCFMYNLEYLFVMFECFAYNHSLWAFAIFIFFFLL